MTNQLAVDVVTICMSLIIKIICFFLPRHGVRNSLLLAPMPTASTAQILGNNESIEPYTSNIYSRRVLSGEFQVVNHHLLKDLTEMGLWNEAMKQKLIAYNGSIQVPIGIQTNVVISRWGDSNFCSCQHYCPCIYIGVINFGQDCQVFNSVSDFHLMVWQSLKPSITSSLSANRRDP